MIHLAVTLSLESAGCTVMLLSAINKLLDTIAVSKLSGEVTYRLKIAYQLGISRVSDGLEWLSAGVGISRGGYNGRTSDQNYKSADRSLIAYECN